MTGSWEVVLLVAAAMNILVLALGVLLPTHMWHHRAAQSGALMDGAAR